MLLFLYYQKSTCIFAKGKNIITNIFLFIIHCMKSINIKMLISKGPCQGLYDKEIY